MGCPTLFFSHNKFITMKIISKVITGVDKLKNAFILVKVLSETVQFFQKRLKEETGLDGKEAEND